MRSPEIVYFEGLPYSGKTTLIRQISAEYPDIFTAIDEYIHPDLLKGVDIDDQRVFMENDELKYQVARDSGRRCLVDRGHLSTVLYSHAYSRIKGDQDLSYVDEWYFGKILRDRMLPDLYILLDISPQISLIRKTTPFDLNNMWDNIDALNYAGDNYPRYIGVYEPDVPVLVLSSNSMTLPQLKDEIVAFFGININYRQSAL